MSNYRDVELSGCRIIGLSNYRDVELSGCRIIGCRIIGMSNYRMSNYRMSNWFHKTTSVDQVKKILAKLTQWQFRQVPF